MKNIFSVLCCCLPILITAQTAKIKIDIGRVVGEVDPKIYGVFMEPIHLNGKRVGLPDSVEFNTLYGTLYDPASPLADANGFRKDYIDAMKELGVTNMRWPGGNYLMGYNWEDGIGPKDQRPTRINLAWGGIDNNHVGTDEWVQLNKSIGSENVVCVNLGLGTINDALHWVEYCNYKKGTYYAGLRAKYGNPQPYNVKIWDLGNEVDGAPWELGHKSAEDYVKIAREAAKAMRAVDSSIQFVASGSSLYDATGQWVEWNHKILGGLGDMVNYISIHRYWENSPDYYSFMGQSAMDFEEKIKVTAGEIEASRAMNNFKNPVYISVDEWGSFGRNFLSVLSTAQCLNSFIRHADVVKMADFTTLTSLLSSDPKNGTFKSPLFYTFKLFSNNCLGSYVDTYVECDTFNTEKFKGIPFLDVTTVYSKQTNTVFINVVNRHSDNTINADVVTNSASFTGNAAVSLITTSDVKAPFAFNNQQQYLPVVHTVATNGNTLQCSFPPHSFTQIKVSMHAK
jgi:alpha-N-arabinofuranosidase